MMLSVLEAIKAQNPNVQIGFVGAHVAVLPEETLREIIR